jgi:predicted metallo-beta-lactamase superfamily hydrolase
MEVRLVAFESLGVRSMCTLVRTSDLTLLIDPSAACSQREGLRPHPLEFEEIVRKRAEILSLSREADVIVTSHYHLDHLSPSETELSHTFATRKFANVLYKEKVLLCKDPVANVSRRQGERGRYFQRHYSKKARRYEIADGKELVFGETKVSFSPALWHGKEGSVQGCVVGTCVDDGSQKVAHSADVQLLNPGCVDWMLEQEADLAIAAGPPIFIKERVSDQDRAYSLGLLSRLTEGVPEVVVDHHLLRAPNWREFLDGLGDARPRAKCAAEREGKKVATHESNRHALYEREQPDPDFHEVLQRGKVPNRLRSIVYETGMEDIYETPLRW